MIALKPSGGNPMTGFEQIISVSVQLVNATVARGEVDFH
jgi:hypothetical protein